MKKLLYVCVTYEGAHCKGALPPPLPEFRASETRPFQTTGVDYAGPRSTKAWMILYTCYSTRAVHLDLVQDMTAETFMRSFRRFTARRGTPARMISDNAKTFKTASVSISSICERPEVKKFFSTVQVQWQFNLEKAPWWGGAFERMIKSAKRCLRKNP